MTKEDQIQASDRYLQDVWVPRVRDQAKRRGSGDCTEIDQCRTVPTEYYSRHQVLKTEGPSYIISPSSQGQKGAPVYAYRPGTTVQQQKPWPTRAHDGSMESKSILKSPRRKTSAKKK
ncbi:uncharacterized protein LOC129219204 [Uloborus diversus]|uniref:uncharacterized protein LOC129219204 n=1 Tax=Uloborus diversus TaxID=327109 RepID=UPI00240A6E94|nr:uncharacterized protein LOC129219204 [Uloborus diversus]